jgi:hypothetical protein
MNSSSNSAAPRAANDTSDAAAPAAQTTAYPAPQAEVILTEVPDSNGGFTVTISLHGSKQLQANPDIVDQKVSIVDVLALAIARTVRHPPESFVESVALVSQTIAEMNDRIEAGVDQDVVIADADKALGGALHTARPPAQ